MKTRAAALLLATIAPALAQIPAFPGAEGFGAFAAGGRGGDVYVVTNLNASGPGSFIDAINTVPTNGRTIVFAVSGYIRIPSGSSGLRLTRSKVTIAGQTAPGGGIGLQNNFFRISSDDVVIRHLRFRHGKNGSGGDCINLDSGSNRTIFDHVSMMFSTDENMSSFSSPPDHLTLQWSLNAWGLQSHSCGGLWDVNRATSRHSLWAHNHTRNPKARPTGLLEWTNNVVFDWNIGFIMGDSETPANWRSNVIGNYFVCPPGNIRNTPLQSARLDRNGNPNFSVHLANNLHDRDGDGSLNGTDRGWSIISGSAYDATTNPTGNYRRLDSPVAGSSPLAIDPPRLAYKKIVSNAGPLRLDASYAGPLRDEVDSRLIQNLTSQTRNIISRESDLAGISNNGFGTLETTTAPIDADADGMPDLYENALGWNAAVQDHNTLVTGASFFPAGTPAGYTRLEEYLYFKAVPHLMLPRNTASAAIDLARYTAGFTQQPVFTVANVTGGTAVQSGPGGRFITFTAHNTAGRGGFAFTVTDAEGDSWTRPFAIAITLSAQSSDLRWRGSGATWDTSAQNWLLAGQPHAFTNGDRVTFEETGAAAPNITVPGPVIASSIEIDSPGPYSFGGAGSISASGQLIKRGSGTATFSNAGSNSFSSIRLLDGILTLNAANAGGSAPIFFEGGALSLAPASNSSIPGNFQFLTDASITTGSQHNVSGLWQGSNRTVTVHATGGQLWTLTNHWNQFSGTLRAGNGNPRIRLNGTTNVNFGSPSVAIDLGGGAAQLMNRNGGSTPYVLGSLSASGSATVLGGTQTGTATSTWQIGALNTDTTFAGTIANGGGATHLVKNGSGTWTLTGTSTHSGNTTVAAGALLLSGTFQNSPVTVQNTALLGGHGTFGSHVTVQSGGILSPGTVPFSAATLTTQGNLNLTGPTLYFDLSNSPAGPNDTIQVGGNLALNGAQNFQFLLLNGPLAPGTYDLIHAANSSASGVSLNHNLPTGSRQSFSLGRSAAGSQPSRVWLTVSGNPATLTWTGAGNATWDTSSPNNWTGGSPNTFFPNDAVVLNDSTTQRTVTLAGTLTPRSITIQTALGYTLAGSGSLSGAAEMVKTGGGNLTLANSGTNNHSGGTRLQQGAVLLADSTANRSGLGTGPVVFEGGTLTMAGFEGNNATSFDPVPNPLVVPAGASGTLHLLQRAPKPTAANIFPGLTGPLSGEGTLNLVVKFVRGDVIGDWSDFSGQLNILPGDADGGDFRFGTSYAWPGLPLASLTLGERIAAYYVGTSADGAGTTITLGEVAGAASSRLLGGNTGGRNFTYRIGGKTPAGGNAVFAGILSEQTPTAITTILKTGPGDWSLTGSGSWNGGLLVEQGGLHLAGPFTAGSTVSVQPAAELRLAAGSLAAASVEIAASARLTGHGSIASDLRLDGSLHLPGSAGNTPQSLAVQGTLTLGDSARLHFRAGPSHDQITVASDLSAAGVAVVTLAPGTLFGRFRLIAASGEITGLPQLEMPPGSPAAHLSTLQAGGIDLVLDDSDEDNLPDSWEFAHFGHLAHGPSGDPDGDGTSNLAEFRLGLRPADASSAFRAGIAGKTLTWPSAPGIAFTIQRSLSLSDGWQTIATLTGPSGQSSASFTDPSSFPRAFYRVLFNP